MAGGTQLTNDSDQPPPAPSNAKIVELTARRRLQPYQQGDFAALCSLYSSIAAIRLVLADVAPLSKGDCRQLYVDGLAFLDGKGWLVDTLVGGMSGRRQSSLARYLARQASDSMYQVEVHRPDPSVIGGSIESVFDWITTSLTVGQPVIIALHGMLDHSSVVAGITPTSLILHDSSGHRFVRRRSCGLTSYP